MLDPPPLCWGPLATSPTEDPPLSWQPLVTSTTEECISEVLRQSVSGNCHGSIQAANTGAIKNQMLSK